MLALEKNHWDVVRLLIEFGVGGRLPEERWLKLDAELEWVSPTFATKKGPALEMARDLSCGQMIMELLEQHALVREVARVVTQWVELSRLCNGVPHRVDEAARNFLADLPRFHDLNAPLPGGSLAELLRANGMPPALLDLRLRSAEISPQLLLSQPLTAAEL